MKKSKKKSSSKLNRKDTAGSKRAKRDKTCDKCSSSFSTLAGLKQHKKIHEKLQESNYKCTICQETFHNAEKFRKHLFMHDVKLYRCESCGHSFKYLQSYMRHLRDYSQPHSFKCDKCNKTFKRLIFLKTHYCGSKDPNDVQTHEEDDQVFGTSSDDDNLPISHLQKNKIDEYKCVQCNWLFTSKCSLERHLKIYSENHFIFPCCGESFKRGLYVINHVCKKNCEDAKENISLSSNSENDSEENRPYKCEHCSASFYRLHSLRHHLKKYPGKHDFHCKDCKKKFPDQSSLEKHLCLFKNGQKFKCSCLKLFSDIKEIKNHVGNQRPYFCCACQMKCITFSNLINHIRTHTKEKPYACSFCDKSFTVKETLRLHLRNHNGIKPFNCSKCNYSSSTKWNLQLHEKRHDPNRKDDKSFLCTKCGAMFYMKHHLRRHALTHTQEKSHLCKICGKLFSQSSYLNKHLENHNNGNECRKCGLELSKNSSYQHHIDTGHFTFVCDPCQKVFYTDNSFEKHMKFHNKGNEKKFKCVMCNKTFVNEENLKKHSDKHK